MWLRENGFTFDLVFMDTGWEHPITLEYIRGTIRENFGHVTEIKSSKYPGGFPDLVKRKGIFPQRQMRFCTDKLKTTPFFDWVKSKNIDDPVVVVLGIRADESSSRSRAPRWSHDAKNDFDVFRPLIKHSYEDIIRMHTEANISPNPLYLQGAERVGCFPCVFSRKSEIAMVNRLYPARVDQIRQLEQELTQGRQDRLLGDPDFRSAIELKARRFVAMRRLKSSGSTMPPQEFRQLFNSCTQGGEYRPPEGGVSPELAEAFSSIEFAYSTVGDKETKSEMSKPVTYFGGRTPTDPKSIDEMVEWSMTTRGGAQLALFDTTARDGCTKWGLCDSPVANLVQIEGEA